MREGEHKDRRLSSRLIALVASFAALACVSIALAAPQASPPAKKTSDQVFKNIQVLKGIPVDDFMGAMGFMTAALGFDCADCHIGAGTEKVDWAADTPRKVTARKMMVMMNSINQDNFPGRQMVTCWSCHRGRDRPLTTPSLAFVYGPVPDDMDDVLVPVPGQPSANQILDKYIQTIGGAERLAGLKSFVATGTSVGFGGFGGGGRVQIFAKFPDQRATIIEFPNAAGRGHSLRIYNGREGWIETPLTVLGEYQLTGGELDGARLDAELSFPGQIKQVLSNFRVSLPTTISDLPGPSSQTSEESKATPGKDQLVNVVQGSGPRGLLATLYFDRESGLLVRLMRSARTPIGRVPTEVDFGDYREVNGIKMPFRVMFAWLNGRDAIQLDQIQTNVPIDPARFNRTPTK
jgi:photosynthetic reaction center cytochrome c subunit